MIINDRLWAGSQDQYEALMKADAGLTTAQILQMHVDKAANTQASTQRPPRLLEVGDDGIATITVAGALVNTESWINEYLGRTAYSEIRDALISAASDSRAKHILMLVDSGGGSASGPDDISRLVRQIHKSVKPVSTYTGSTMASAAYWIGAAAGKVYADRTAMVGSIGVIAVVKEYTEMMKSEGVGVTVIRAGKYKALANGYEKLTAPGEKQVQDACTAVYDVFIESMAGYRGVSAQKFDDEMGQGREFTGQAAMDAGLVDGITTYDALVGKIRAKISQDTAKTRSPFGAKTSTVQGEQDMAIKKALTEQDLAAIAAGVTLEASTEEVELTAEQVAAAALAAAKPEGEGDGVAAPVAKVETPGVTADAVVTLLQTQLATAQSDLVAAKVELAGLQTFKTTFEASSKPLMEIVAKATNNMTVALKGSASDLSALSATELLARHAEVAATFQKQFKAGGVASTDATKQEQKPVETARNQRLQNLARIHVRN